MSKKKNQEILNFIIIILINSAIKININLKKIGWNKNLKISININMTTKKILIILIEINLKTFLKFLLCYDLSQIWEWRTICTYFITSYYLYNEIILINPLSLFFIGKMKYLK